MNFMAPLQAPRSSDDIDTPPRLLDVWGALMRRRRLIVGAFVIIGALTAAAIMLQTPRYAATASIMINQGQERVLSDEQALTNSTATSATIDSETEVLRSHEMARKVAQALELVGDPRWNGALAREGLFGQILGTLRGALTPTEAASDADNPEALLNAVASNLAQAVTIRRRALSYVVDISVVAATPQEAARIANAYVDVYLTSIIESQSATGRRATGWLGQRLRELEQDLAAKESAVAAYRAQSGLLVSDGDSLTEQQVRDVQGTVLTARAELAEKQARYTQVQRMLQSGESAESIGDALNSQVIRDLRREEAEISRQQIDLETQLGALHPDVINGRNQLEDIRRQIRDEVQRIANGLRNEVEVARARLGSLQGTLDAASGQMASSNSSEVELLQLERQATAARNVYEAFLQRSHEIVDQGQIAAAQVRVISQATPPREPSSPNPKLALLLAVAAGLLGAAVLTFIAEALNDVVLRADEIERRVGAPALTSVPMVTRSALRLLAPNDRNPAGYAVEKPMSAYAESFRVLRTSITFSNVDRKTQVVAITSALPEEGKTTSSLSLGRIAALSNQRVIVVDCDLRRHSVNALLGIAPPKGLMQVLAGEVDWRDVIGRDENTDVHVLPVAESAFTPRDVFGSQAMERLLEDLRRHYDLIVLDCPPVWAVAETRVIAAHADAAILVAKWSKTPIRALASASHHLERAGVKVLGVVVNCFDPRSSTSAGYSDVGYYAYSSGKYFAS